MIASQRMKLALLWWMWGGTLILLMAAFSYQPILFGRDLSAVWEWFLPNLVPTLTLVSAVVAFDQQPPGSALAGHHKHHFYVAIIASVIYLLLLSFAVVSVLFATDPLSSVQKSNFWLGPIQGLSASATGVFFTKQHGA